MSGDDALAEAIASLVRAAGAVVEAATPYIDQDDGSVRAAITALRDASADVLARMRS